MQTVPLDPPEDEDLDPDEIEADEELAALPDDFADLDADLAAAMAQQGARVELTHAQARFKKLSSSKKPDHQREREELLIIIRNLEEGIVWTRTANVVLLRQQLCLTCGHTTRYSLGWWTEQQHKTDHHCRRLLRGLAVEDLPEKVEVHEDDPIEVCADCAESVIIIDIASKEHSCTVHHESSSTPATGSSSETVASDAPTLPPSQLSPAG